MSTTTEPTDRLFGALPYLLPLVYALPFGLPLLVKFPQLSILYVWLGPLFLAVNSTRFTSLIIFIILYAGVVRNTKIHYFIRFNTLQGILINIAIVLLGIVIDFLGIASGGGGILVETSSSVVFLGTLTACFYAISQSIMGKYAELPTISQAAYSQLPY